MTTPYEPTELMMLRARASVARRLVKEGVLDGYTALSYAVWPTERILEAERQVPFNTTNFRAMSWRGEKAA